MVNHRVKIIKATRDLQAKAGVGDIPPERILRAERTIEHNEVNFQHIAPPFLNDLHDAIQRARGAAGDPDELIDDLIRPVMELKANAHMFKYTLVGVLANIMLGFLEHAKELDSDIIDIIDAHQKTLDLIVNTGMSGDGGPNGVTLKTELEKACDRYFKHNPGNFKQAI